MDSRFSEFERAKLKSHKAHHRSIYWPSFTTDCTKRASRATLRAPVRREHSFSRRPTSMVGFRLALVVVAVVPIGFK